MFSKFKTVIITILLKRVSSDNPKKIEAERVKRPWGNICLMFEVESHCGKNLFADDLNRTKIINERNRVLSHLKSAHYKNRHPPVLSKPTERRRCSDLQRLCKWYLSIYGSRCVPKFSAWGPPRVLKHLSFLLEGKKGTFSMFTLSLFFSSGIFNVSSTY